MMIEVNMHIPVDKESEFWSDDRDYLKLRLELGVRHLKSKFVSKGYLYLNQIYEEFGLKWYSTKYQNLILRRDSYDYFSIELDEEASGDKLIFISLYLCIAW